jgi:phage replication-related protein YjqB (UPF0714/DUF867 family)
MDVYSCYDDLRLREEMGRDYLVLVRRGITDLVVMAPHGGGIEPGTVDIADAVAGADHSFYAFKGIKRENNRTLHLTSSRFDEPVALDLVSGMERVVTVHGHRASEAKVFLGGRDRVLGDALVSSLLEAGVNAAWSTRSSTRGIHTNNICNRGRRGMGVQLEFSRGLRERMFQGLASRRTRHRTALFHVVVDALRKALGPVKRVTTDPAGPPP